MKEIPNEAEDFKRMHCESYAFEELEERLTAIQQYNYEQDRHYDFLNEIHNYPSVWINPSDQLLSLLPPSELGIIQPGHIDWDFLRCEECMIDDYNYDMAWYNCYDNYCTNCHGHGFPCSNFAFYGYLPLKLDCRWYSGHDYGLWPNRIASESEH